jgi:hypothetical protein
VFVEKTGQHRMIIRVERLRELRNARIHGLYRCLCDLLIRVPRLYTRSIRITTSNLINERSFSLDRIRVGSQPPFSVGTSIQYHELVTAKEDIKETVPRMQRIIDSAATRT